MHTLILGLGISGKAALEFCQKRGDHVSVYDDVSAPHPVKLDQIERVIKSPGIALSHPIAEAAQKAGIPVMGEIDLALAEIKGKTLYGVTGSNGKTTTTLLTAHLLNLSGKKTLAVGNVGTSLLSQVDSDYACLVVELSSFQLESIVERPVFDGAVLLNLTPNHLDRHKTFAAYAQAKLRLQSCLKKGAPFYISEQVARAFPVEGHVFDIETFSQLSYRDRRLYAHDLQNCAAAAALAGVERKVVEEGLKTFVKPPHRIEFVREWRGVSFINDSKATSVDAVKKAVEALPAQVVLIAGGIDKGGLFQEWTPLFREKVRMVYALGEAASRIESELSPSIQVVRVSSLDEGVKKAAHYAQKGDTVLLSPGCSSFDQFKNYEHRGERFKELVGALEEIPS
ncbi:MAG: UDP-N-acetylmuramoylalanine--D-glutamate ligase [Chlamydiales bacterium]|nr:UDP-N-acetylmuramoylalanine--D-glutamate ligase [Chlamydiales bacterium]